MDAKSLKKLQELLEAAADGRQPELHQVVLNAGYQPGPGWIVPRQDLVARFFGVTVRQVRNWFNEMTKEDKCRESRPGKKGGQLFNYDLQAIAAWRIRKAEEAAESRKSGKQSLSISDRLKLLDLKERKAELVNKRDAQVDVNKMILAARVVLQSLPEDLALLASEKETQAVLLEEGKRVVHDALRTLRRIKLYDEDVIRELVERYGK